MLSWSVDDLVLGREHAGVIRVRNPSDDAGQHQRDDAPAKERRVEVAITLRQEAKRAYAGDVCGHEDVREFAAGPSGLAHVFDEQRVEIETLLQP